MKALRSVRSLVLVAAALFSTVLVAGLLLAAPLPPRLGGAGSVLALRAALHALISPAAHPKTFQSFGVPTDLNRASDGRYIYNKRTLMRSGALRSRVAGASAQVNEAVQTFDVFNPPPAFAPAAALTPTNLTPVWTADETMLIFSSNRTAAGGVQLDGSFHIWAIPINGGTPVQLTSSTVAAGASTTVPHGELFPTLSANNNQQLAFTSDANSPNVQNLYVIPFTAATVTVSTQPSPTIQGVDSAGNSITGFSNVGRPVFSPSNPDEIIFAATSTAGTYHGHSHLYYLYVSTKGYNPGALSLPAKITDGLADDTDPSYSQDGLAIAFSSTSTALAPTNLSPSSDPNTSLISSSATTAPAAIRSVYVIGGGGAFGFGTVLNGGAPITAAGADNYGPAWSSAKRNSYTNPVGGQEYIAFARGGASQAAPHDIYSLLVLQNNTAGVAQLLPESASNAAIKLNSDDNAGETSTGGNVYDDIYPTWSPFSTIYSLAYSSNRTVTYSDPTTGSASETAISVGEGQSLGSGVTVGANYAGILESQFLNLDPPSLLPYSGNEIIHVANSAGVTTRYGITPGQPVTLTVRLSDREAGVDDSNVYLQIKDPDSKYQDAQGLEHKVFARDGAYRTQRNNPYFNAKNPAQQNTIQDSRSSILLLNGGGYTTYVTNPGNTTYNKHDVLQDNSYYGYNQFTSSGGFLFDPGNRGAIAGIEGPESFLSGTAVTSSTAPQTNGIIGSISIGTSGGGTNTDPVTDKTGKPITDPDTKQVIPNPPGSDPDLFIPWGPEFECQVVNPQFAAASGAVDTIPADYHDPYYLAGIDDQQPFSGSGKVRPVADGTDINGNFAPAEWLQLTRLPAAQQDGQGGILYSVQWKTPTSGSDYYLDVIAFDKAVAPVTYVPTSGTASGSNWRIYDNIWGFSTASSIGSNDILVVNDYALGQKFAATTFGGQRGLLNLVPKLYGAESYYTDIDVNLLPNAVYRHQVLAGANQDDPSREVLDLDHFYAPSGRDLGADNALFPYWNGLGVGSYYDNFVDDGTTQDGVPSPPSQQYSQWRVLSRGPVPESVYKLYEPNFVTQPAVADTAAKVSIAAGSVPVANRCILWVSPFTGDVLAGAGTLSDAATQTSLRSFVKAGGRLCVSGQDVGSALTQGGTANNTPGGFLPDVLNATLTTTNAGTHLPAPGATVTDSRLTFSPSYDLNLVGSFEELQVNGTRAPISLRERLIRVSNNYGGNIFEQIYPPSLQNIANWRTDGSLDQLGPYVQPFLATGTSTTSLTSGVLTSTLLAANSVVAQIDTITPGVTAHTDLTLAPFTNQIAPVQYGNVNASTAVGGAGLIYTESPLGTSGGTGSKVVYATFGLEALSAEVYRQTSSFKPNPDIYEVRNVRQGLIHNIVSYLRTGTITGTVRSTSGNGTGGAGVAGATVYLASANLQANGPAIPGRGTFSATTDGSGNFNINGIEPGSYTLVAYADGYLRATSNPGLVFVIEGDTTQQASLTLTQAPPGTITGQVTDNSKNAVTGASVIFTASNGQTKSTITDVNGNYTLTSIPPGAYTGTASKAGSGSATQTTTLPSGQTVTVNFVLTPGPGTASGRVVNTSGTPVAGATVFFNSGTPPVLTATTDANGAYTLANLAAGSYVVTASDLPTYGLSAPLVPNVVIISAEATTVPDIVLGAVTNGTLGGLVTAVNSTAPLAGVTITVVNTANNQSVTAATVGTSSTGSDSSPINYGPLTLGQGTYTVTATQNGITVGTQTIAISGTGFVRADFAGTSGVAAIHTFPPGIQFVSAPYDYSSLGFDSLFGTLNTAVTGTTPNGNRSHVAVWNPLTAAYALDPSAPADKPRPGVGYWVYLKNPFQVNQAGTPLTGSVPVALNPSWNQIGVPSLSGVSVSGLNFTVGGQSLTFAQASSSQYHVVFGTLYRYDGTAYQRVLSTDTLQPWQAYWILAYTPVTLNIPTGK